MYWLVRKFNDTDTNTQKWLVCSGSVLWPNLLLYNKYKKKLNQALRPDKKHGKELRRVTTRQRVLVNRFVLE